jgi:hypothetical protein
MRPPGGSLFSARPPPDPSGANRCAVRPPRLHALRLAHRVAREPAQRTIWHATHAGRWHALAHQAAHAVLVAGLASRMRGGVGRLVDPLPMLAASASRRSCLASARCSASAGAGVCTVGGARGWRQAYSIARRFRQRPRPSGTSRRARGDAASSLRSFIHPEQLPRRKQPQGRPESAQKPGSWRPPFRNPRKDPPIS